MKAPKGWAVKLFGELTENFDALRVPVKESDRRPGPYPYYGATGIVDWVDSYIFEGGYLLIAEDGENLKSRKAPIAYLARGKFWVNNHAHIVRGNNDSDTRFLLYAISSADVGAYLTGSTMPKLTQDNLNRIPILAPPPAEQRAIAHILGTLDDKIDLNRRMNETLETMARAIFKSWFVDFDPVKRNQARNGGETATSSEALAKEDALFPASFQDSPFGRIPKGWRVGKMAEIVSLSHEAVSPGDFPEEVFDHYSIPAFDEGRWPSEDTGEQIKSNKLVVPGEAVLLSKLNPRFPRVWLPTVSGVRRSIASTEFLVASPRPDFSREYVFALFGSQEFVDVFETLVTGTSGSHQRVKPEFLLAMDVVVPSQQCAECFAHLAGPLCEKSTKNLAESRTLAAIRDTLLPKLISGEIRVKEAERFISEVV